MDGDEVKAFAEAVQVQRRQSIGIALAVHDLSEAVGHDDLAVLFRKADAEAAIVRVGIEDGSV